jgi:hypothetical protein
MTDDPNNKTADRPLKTNVLNADTWIRLLYMLLFGLLLTIARMVIWVVAIVQFLFVLISGEDNTNLRSLGQGVTRWVSQALLFLTFNSDEKPFPFSDWPDTEPVEGEIILVGEADEYTTAEPGQSIKDSSSANPAQKTEAASNDERNEHSTDSNTENPPKDHS